jgi:PleD family two-component response regulator
MKKNVLIIQSPVSLNISDWIELSDFNILVAGDGISGLLMAKQFPIDLVISEIHLAKLNGFELLKELRKNSGTAKVPVIFITSKLDSYSQKKAQELEINDYLTKLATQIIPLQISSPVKL